MSTTEIIFLVVSLGVMIALSLAIYKLGNSVPAWVLDVARAGAGLGADWAEDTPNTVDDVIWKEVLEKLDELEAELSMIKGEHATNSQN